MMSRGNIGVMSRMSSTSTGELEVAAASQQSPPPPLLQPPQRDPDKLTTCAHGRRR